MLTSGSITLLWSGHNYIRYDDFSVARGRAIVIPSFRAFVVDRIVHPSNGKYSQELADRVASDLLTEEPYRSYGINVDQFFSSGSQRAYLDLVGLSDRTWGWNTDYENLFWVGVEAVRAYPAAYAKGVTRDFIYLLTGRYKHQQLITNQFPEPLKKDGGLGTIKSSESTQDGKKLPTPSENQLIPRPALFWLASAPEKTRSTDWSDLSNPKVLFLDSEVQRNFDLRQKTLGAFPDLPNRVGSYGLSKFLNNVTKYIYPGIIVWVIAGITGLFIRPFYLGKLSALIQLMALSMILVVALGIGNRVMYSLPLYPVLFLWGTIGFQKLFKNSVIGSPLGE